jgi:3',5'-cyclic AMP phosphodiesterase CpdA
MAVFAQITDLHLRPPGTLTLGRVDADRFAAAAIDAVILRHADVDAVLVTGDITDLGEEEAYARAAMLLSRFAVPVLVAPGNHDRLAPFRDAFLAWPGIAEPAVPQKACHAARFGDVTVVTLDTAVDGADHGELGPEQLAWLDGTLAAAETAIVAMHHPPFPVGIGFMDRIGLLDAEAFARVVGRHPQVKRIVCGHVHRVIIGDVAGVAAVAIPGVAHQVTLALGEGAVAAMVMEPPAYAIHTVEAGRATTHLGYVGTFGGPIPFAGGDR